METRIERAKINFTDKIDFQGYKFQGYKGVVGNFDSTSPKYGEGNGIDRNAELLRAYHRYLPINEPTGIALIFDGYFHDLVGSRHTYDVFVTVWLSDNGNVDNYGEGVGISSSPAKLYAPFSGGKFPDQVNIPTFSLTRTDASKNLLHVMVADLQDDSRVASLFLGYRILKL